MSLKEKLNHAVQAVEDEIHEIREGAAHTVHVVHEEILDVEVGFGAMKPGQKLLTGLEIAAGTLECALGDPLTAAAGFSAAGQGVYNAMRVGHQIREGQQAAPPSNTNEKPADPAP